MCLCMCVCVCVCVCACVCVRVCVCTVGKGELALLHSLAEGLLCNSDVGLLCGVLLCHLTLFATRSSVHRLYHVDDHCVCGAPVYVRDRVCVCVCVCV